MLCDLPALSSHWCRLELGPVNGEPAERRQDPCLTVDAGPYMYQKQHSQCPRTGFILQARYSSQACRNLGRSLLSNRYSRAASVAAASPQGTPKSSGWMCGKASRLRCLTALPTASRSQDPAGVIHCASSRVPNGVKKPRVRPQVLQPRNPCSLLILAATAI
jgi:hypothetical protein